MSDDIAAQVRTIIRSLSPYDEHEIAADDRLVEDLGLNSITLVQLSVMLQHEFGLTVGPEEAATVSTVGELESFVAASTGP
jgi:acyl carrier protein